MACDHCTRGYILPGEPTGTMVDGHYYSPAPEGSTSKKSSAILVLTDIFGLNIQNPKIIADRLAKQVGCDVWVPDVFDGKPPFTFSELRPLLPDTGLSRAFRLFNCRPAKADPRIQTFITNLKKERNYGAIGAVGYCYGGAMGIRLGSTSFIDSLIVCHPSIESTDGVKALKVPTSFVCAEADMSFTPELRNTSEAILLALSEKEDKIEYEFKDYKGTVHGFATRPNLSKPAVVDAYESALQQTAAWFDKTLP